MGNRVGGIPSASCGGSQTTAWWCSSDGNSHYPKLPHTLVNHLESNPSHHLEWDPCRGCVRRWGDAGPIMGIRLTPCSEIAACLLKFPPDRTDRSAVVDDISTTPSAIGQVEGSLVQVHKVVRWFSWFHYMLYTEDKNYMYFHFGQDTLRSKAYTLHILFYSHSKVYRSSCTVSWCYTVYCKVQLLYAHRCFACTYWYDSSFTLSPFLSNGTWLLSSIKAPCISLGLMALFAMTMVQIALQSYAGKIQ